MDGKRRAISRDRTFSMALQCAREKRVSLINPCSLSIEINFVDKIILRLVRSFLHSSLCIFSPQLDARWDDRSQRNDVEKPRRERSIPPIIRPVSGCDEEYPCIVHAQEQEATAGRKIERETKAKETKRRMQSPR